MFNKLPDKIQSSDGQWPWVFPWVQLLCLQNVNIQWRNEIHLVKFQYTMPNELIHRFRFFQGICLMVVWLQTKWFARFWLMWCWFVLHCCLLLYQDLWWRPNQYHLDQNVPKCGMPIIPLESQSKFLPSIFGQHELEENYFKALKVYIQI